MSLSPGTACLLVDGYARAPGTVGGHGPRPGVSSPWQTSLQPSCSKKSLKGALSGESPACKSSHPLGGAPGFCLFPVLPHPGRFQKRRLSQGHGPRPPCPSHRPPSLEQLPGERRGHRELLQLLKDRPPSATECPGGQGAPGRPGSPCCMPLHCKAKERSADSL